MKNSTPAVIYKKMPYGAKGSTKLHIKMTEKAKAASGELPHMRVQTNDQLLEDIAGS